MPLKLSETLVSYICRGALSWESTESKFKSLTSTFWTNSSKPLQT